MVVYAFDFLTYPLRRVFFRLLLAYLVIIAIFGFSDLVIFMVFHFTFSVFSTNGLMAFRLTRETKSRSDADAFALEIAKSLTGAFSVPVSYTIRKART